MNATDDKKSQIDKFKEAAHELGCDDDEQAFADKLRRVAKKKAADSRSKD